MGGGGGEAEFIWELGSFSRMATSVARRNTSLVCVVSPSSEQVTDELPGDSSWGIPYLVT